MRKRPLTKNERIAGALIVAASLITLISSSLRAEGVEVSLLAHYIHLSISVILLIVAGIILCKEKKKRKK